MFYKNRTKTGQQSYLLSDMHKNLTSTNIRKGKILYNLYEILLIRFCAKVAMVWVSHTDTQHKEIFFKYSEIVLRPSQIM